MKMSMSLKLPSGANQMQTIKAFEEAEKNSLDHRLLLLIHHVLHMV